MKHLDLKFYWLRDKVEEQVISVHYIGTELMPADLLTKPLPLVKVLSGCKLLGVGRK